MANSAARELSGVQRERLRQICGNRFNWTDGGHWIGQGASPDCSVKEERQVSHVVGVYFSSDAAAERWNAECERNIRFVGHGGTVLLGLASYLTGGSVIAVGALVAASIGKDELQAMVPYPKAYRGSRLLVRHELSLDWFAAPRARSSLTVRRAVRMSDHQGLKTHLREHEDRFDVCEQVAGALGFLFTSGDTERHISL